MLQIQIIVLHLLHTNSLIHSLTMTPINKKILFAIVSVIENLENKREEGIITMTEEAILISLVEKAEYILSL